MVINQKSALDLQAWRKRTIHLRQAVAVKSDKPKKRASLSFWRSSAKASEALALAETIYRSQAVIVFNMDGTIMTANQHCLDTLGYRLAEILGRRYSNLVPATVRDPVDFSHALERPCQGKTRTAWTVETAGTVTPL